VTEEPTNKELTQKIIEELGGLISRRITRYHSKFFEDDEVKFFNNFFVCPDEDDDEYNLIGELVDRKIHFDDCLDIGLEGLFLQRLDLSKDRASIIYSFSWMIFHLSKNDKPVFLKFELVKDKILFPNPSTVNFLEGLKETFLIDLLKHIRKEITFGTLSLD